ncbi:MAG: AMP-binding protein [Pseudomonadota bacterium]
MLPPFNPWLLSRIAADVVAASHADAEALAARQSQRLADLLASAASSSPLYRRLLKGSDPAHLQLDELPVMGKAVLMSQFDDWVTDPALHLDALRRFTADRSRIAEPFLGRYVVWESSGSSGEPGIFVQDAAAMAVYDALEAVRRPVLRPLQRLLDPWCMGERIAFVGATDGHFASTVTLERIKRLNPAMSRCLHGISFLLPPEQLMAKVQALDPTVIATYPSAAVLLAEERLAGRLEIAPREVWTGGETLSVSMRKLVQQAFGCQVVDSYGASEFISMAIDCPYGHLHLNSDWVILESVDDQGRVLPAGEAGTSTLLTNLANHVQPLIRYNLGDSIRLYSHACACGSHLPVIEVQGRSDDTLRLGRPGEKAVSVLPLAFSTVLEEGAGLFDFQIVQQGPSELLLSTGMRGEAAIGIVQRAGVVLAAFLAQQGLPDVTIHCLSDHPARQGRSGKIQRVVALKP